MAIHNQKFINKFNEAIKELDGDESALATFNLAVMEVYSYFAKQNKMNLTTLIDKLNLVNKKEGRQ